MNNTIRKRILAIFVAVASVLGLIGLTSSSPVSAAAARPAVVATSATDCSQSAFLGARVCVDKTTAYGSVALIYTSGTTLYTSFAVSVSNVPGAWTATPYEYVVGSVTGATALVAVANCIENPCPAQIASGGNQSLMDWFANDANYEFVLTN